MQKRTILFFLLQQNTHVTPHYWFVEECFASSKGHPKVGKLLAILKNTPTQQVLEKGQQQ